VLGQRALLLIRSGADLFLLASILQLEIPCSGHDDFAAAQAVLKVMYTCKFDSETLLIEQNDGSLPSLVQIMIKVRLFFFISFTNTIHFSLLGSSILILALRSYSTSLILWSRQFNLCFPLTTPCHRSHKSR